MAAPEDVAAFHHKIKPETFWQKLCLVVLCAATTTPAMELSGFSDLLPDWPLPIWVVLSGMVSAGVGLTYYPQWRYGLVGMLPGMLAGPCVLLLTYFYTIGRETVYRAEMALVWVVGLAPAALLYYGIMRLVVLSTSRPSQTGDYVPPDARPTHWPMEVPASAPRVPAFGQQQPPAPTVASQATPALEPVAATPMPLAPSQPMAGRSPTPGRPGSRLGWIVAGVSIGCGGFLALMLLAAIGSFVLHGKGRGPAPVIQPQAVAPVGQAAGIPLNQQQLDALVSDLQSADRNKQRAAVRRLAAAGPGDLDRQPVAAALMPLLHDDDVFVRRGAAEALGHWATADDVPALIAMLASDDFLLRRFVMQALGQLGDARAAEPLVQRLSTGADRTYATTALRALGPPAEKALHAALTSEDVFARAEACRLLGEFGTAESLDVLAAAAADKNGLVNTAAKKAQQSIRDRQK